ncbi:ribosomal protein S6 kinase-related protein-like [Argonauta hians]
MGNNQNKPRLRKSHSVPDTQTFLVDSLLVRGKSRSSARLARLSSINDVRDSSFSSSSRRSRELTQTPVPLTETLFFPEFAVRGELEDQNFELIAIIAKGAYGNVLKVHRNDEKQFYAVKVLEKRQIILENAVQQCKDEACIQSMLGHHPFIVKVLEFWQSRTFLYIVLTYVPYGDMFTLWSYHGYFPEELVCYHVAQLASVLSYLHKSGVIYRDMKMENILFDYDGNIQVTDFGLAKWLHIGEKTRTVCGTLQYMAPEVLSVVPYGHSADWWSLGVLMYTMLMGEYPVDGAVNHFEMAQRVFDCEYEIPEYISEKCAHVVARLLTKCHNRRLTDLFSLQNLPFFRGINFNALIEKQVSLRTLVPEGFFDVPADSEEGEESYTYNDSNTDFSEFDEYVWHLPPDVVPVFV